MIDESELLRLMADLESHRIERTISARDTDKFAEAVCAFANDMPGSGLPGYLLVGVEDKSGRASGLRVTDEILRNLAGLASDGNILPAPALSVERIVLASGEGEVAVVEVRPSDLPPVRYKGRVWIRRGPRKGVANEAEERLLAERRTAAARTFDALPCRGAAISDLALDLFTTTYLPQAVDSETLAENHRSLELQLASLRFYDAARGCPTNAGMILFAKNPLLWLPGAYLQHVGFGGDAVSDEKRSERRFDGDLLTVLRELDAFAKSLAVSRSESDSTLRERTVYDYPPAALREFLMNAVMHRSYESTAPVRIYEFEDRLEILNPGPLYGEATPLNFPRQNSYRNPVIAEAMRTLGFVNKFGHGVERAKAALEKNGNPPPEFEFGDTFMAAVLRKRP